MSNYVCNECKDDPRGVLGLNQWFPCRVCNHIPLTAAEKDRAVYDLNEVLNKPFVRVLCPDDARKEKDL